MDAMTLGSYTFWRNPDQFTIPRQQKYASVIPTYGGVAYFSWGLFLAGQKVLLEWDVMTKAMWDELQTILENDTGVVWDPQTGTAYNVEVLQLEGKYVFKSLLDGAYRREVKLTLLIKSQV